MKTYGNCASITRGIFYCALFTFLGVSILAATPPEKDPTIPPKDPENLECDQQHPKCYDNRIDKDHRVLLLHHITDECQKKHQLKHELEYSCWTECHAWWPLKHSPLGPPELVPRDVFLVYATLHIEKTFSAMHFDTRLCDVSYMEYKN
ncbi:unnamed protein product [Cylicocyclus nassatus]|uniref:Uncharacterized protein n=1 Tax=Cylicocyclus nassatus TaxID=53992 RepID=A0AA36DTN8_CYLNA|nr:unnamed protein product [Cylicocyclus nassatus]